MATPTHTPEGRGFQTSLNYFHHGNNYWSQGTGDKTCPVGIDLWNAPGGGAPGRAAHSIWNPNSTEGNIANYEETYFRERFLHVVAQHDPSAAPLFLYYAAHLVHDPLQVPQVYLDMMSKAGGGAFDNATDTSDKSNERMTYHAMAKALDDQVGNLTAAVKAKGYVGQHAAVVRVGQWRSDLRRRQQPSAVSHSPVGKCANRATRLNRMRI